MEKGPRRLSQKYKYIVGITIILITCLMAKFAVGNSLKGEEFEEFVNVTSQATEIKPDTRIKTGLSSFTLKSSEKRLIKIPDNEAYSIAAAGGDDKTAEVVLNAPSNFDEESFLKKFQPDSKTKETETSETKKEGSKEESKEQTANSEGEKEESSNEDAIGNIEEEVISSRSSLFHQAQENSGYTYITLLPNEPLEVVFRHTKLDEKVAITVTDVESEKNQTLFTFDPQKEAIDNITPVLKKREKQKTEKEESTKEETQEAEVDYNGFRGPGQDPIHISTAVIDPTKSQDGTPKFDKDNLPGHDKDGNNGIVRSFDSVSYNVAFGVQTNPGQQPLTDVKYVISAEYPNAITTVNGQKTFYVGFGGGRYRVEGTGETAYENQEGTLATSDSSITVPMILEVFGAPNGYQIKPTIKVKLISGKDKNGKTVQLNSTSENLVKNPITVSSKVSLKAILGTDKQTRAKYDAVAGTTGEFAYTQLFAVSLALTPLQDGSRYDSSDYRGVAYPTGTISGNIKTRVVYSTNSVPVVNQTLTPQMQEQPQIISFGPINNSGGTTGNFVKTAQFNGVSIKPQSANYTDPSAVYSNGGNNSAANSSGTISMSNASSNEMNFSFTNPGSYPFPRVYIDEEKNIEPENRFIASGFGVMKLPYDYIKDKSGAIQAYYNLDKITYVEDGQRKEQKVSSEITMTADNNVEGEISNYTVWLSNGGEKLGSSNNDRAPAGDEKILMGSDGQLKVSMDADSLDTKYLESLTVWNGETANLRGGAQISITGNDFQKDTLQYGVLKNGGKYSGLDVGFDVKKDKFNWYDTYDEAKRNGTITGVYSKFLKTTSSAKASVKLTYNTTFVSGVPGEKDKNGNPNVAYNLSRMSDASGRIINNFPSENDGNFIPTVYNQDGTIQSNQQPQTTYGDTLYFMALQTRINKRADKKQYLSKETITWTLTPFVYIKNNDDYTVTIYDIMPGAFLYVKGSMRDAQTGDPVDLGEPEIKVDEEYGTQYLTWTKVINPSKGINMPAFTYDTVINPERIYYGSTLTSSPTNSARISAQSVQNPFIKDLTSDFVRTGSYNVTIKKAEELSVSLRTEDPIIEVGNNDSAAVGKTDSDGLPTRLDDIHYSMYMTNGTTNTISNARLLNVFPYKNDGRGTTYDGKYQLLNTKFVGNNSNAKIYYTTSESVTAETDPLSININQGWSLYTSDSKVSVDNIRGILIVVDSLEPNATVSIQTAILPKDGKKAGTEFFNDAILNSAMDIKVKSPRAETSVGARALSGVSWFDDDENGKNDNREEAVPNVPVKIYRKSEDFKETKYKLLEKDLLGNDLTNLKTDRAGKYEVNSIPEGSYKIIFQIGWKYASTIKDSESSSVAENTSKVNPVSETDGAASTDEYIQPAINSGKFSKAQPTFHLKNINAGFLRQGTITIYKYMAGLIADADEDYLPDNPDDVQEDGSLTNQEAILPGALFEIREVVTDANTDEVLSSESLGQTITDTDGSATFDLPVLNDEVDESGKVVKKHVYHLVEIEAPSGYELLKKEIELNPIAGKTVRKYIPNKTQTKLPYTGSNDIMQLILIIAGSIFLVSLSVVGVQLFRLDDGFKRQI